MDKIAREFYPLRKAYAEHLGVKAKEIEELSPPEKEFIESLENFQLVETGAARCLLTPTCEQENETTDVVFKIARSAEPNTIYDGREQNEYESFLYSAVQDKFTDEERPRLLPILESDENNYWIKLPFVPILFDMDISSERRDNIREEVLRSLRPIIDNVMIGEVTSDNIGKYNRKWYLVDYGADPLVAESL